MRMIAGILSGLLIVLIPAIANAQQRGVAFVQAVEQSSGVCFAENLDKGFECARQKCAANGTARADCYRVKWCFPAGWSADIFMQHKEGPHWHEYLCGWSSESDLRAAIKLACDGDRKPYLIECSAVSIWDNEGKETN